ncbi:MAG: hypothetical protein C4547_07940 [Phycisphaerales bacterium]|nr:MAG: hypothetical protein C4547_07940 [Phycisphaerales bacterium]
MTDPEVRRAGLEALSERLGPAGMIRFLRMFDPGRGDYTEERHQWLDQLTLEDIRRSIEVRRTRETK